MPSTTGRMDQIGTAALKGWRGRVGDAVATPIAANTGVDRERARAVIGLVFLALSVVYVVRTVTAVARREGRAPAIS